MKCKFCGETITDEMKELGACLNCGNAIDLSLEEEKYYTSRAQGHLDVQIPASSTSLEKDDISQGEEEVRQILSLMEQEGRKLTEKRYKEKQVRAQRRAEELVRTGCWEYRVIKVQDQNGWFSNGAVNAEAMVKELNHLGANGWHLVSAYTNELGKNLVSAGGIGINSTCDEHILIFERKINDIDRFPMNELE